MTSGTSVKGWSKWAVVFGLALLLTVVIDLLTNSMEVRPEYDWDYIQYIDMAENGIIGNENLVGPFAYRPVTSLLASAFSDIFTLDTEGGFRVDVYSFSRFTAARM